MRLFEKYWLRKNWRVFSANLRKTMEIARGLMRSWLYRTKDYQAYKRTLKLVRMLQYDFRYRKLRRLHRIDMARKEFERSVARTFLDRYRYLKLKKASLVIQRNYVIAKFKKLVHGRIAVRQLLLEEYKTTVWPGIIQLLQSKSCQIIQDNFRGYLARTKHANEVNKLEDFKKNWKRHQASARISAFFKACYVRQKMKKITQASIKIQRKWRKKILLRAQNTVIKAARVIQVGVGNSRNS
jgi:hypothetical protein